MQKTSSLSDRSIRVASIQMESRPGDKEANFAKLEQFATEAANQGARLVVAPECCLTTAT